MQSNPWENANDLFHFIIFISHQSALLDVSTWISGIHFSNLLFSTGTTQWNTIDVQWRVFLYKSVFDRLIHAVILKCTNSSWFLLTDTRIRIYVLVITFPSLWFRARLRDNKWVLCNVLRVLSSLIISSLVQKKVQLMAILFSVLVNMLNGSENNSSCEDTDQTSGPLYRKILRRWR